MGTGYPVVTLPTQKCNTCSSTISELVAVNERMVAQILWTRLFMRAQGMKVSDNILFQDIKSVILIEKKGWASSSKQMKHIELQYYYDADCIETGDLSVVWYPTEMMIADFLTKPLQGKMSQEFRYVLMVVALMHRNIGYRWIPRD